MTRCTQMNLGDTLSLDTECRGALAHEKALREGFESVCRSIAIKQLPVPEKDPKSDDEPKPEAPGAEIPSESENTAVQK